MSDTETHFQTLQRGLHSVLKTYSNVHRGSGYYSLITTCAYEKARELVLDYFHLDNKEFTVIFCPPFRSKLFLRQLSKEDFMMIDSSEMGLCVGVVAIALKKKALGKIERFHSGGGTAKMISAKRIIWADAPERFETGTPAIVNICLFAKALKILRDTGNKVLLPEPIEILSVADILYRDETEQKSGIELLCYLREIMNENRVNVPTSSGQTPYINLDNGASTPAFPQTTTVFEKVLVQPANMRDQIVAEVRSICHRFLKASPETYEINFNSGTTEGINMLAESISVMYDRKDPVIVNSLLEHNSNNLPWRTVAKAELITVPVDKKGIVDINALETILREYNQEHRHGKKRIIIVSISGASNVLGIYNDLKKISDLVHHYQATILVDAAQMIAHREIDMDGCGIDYLVFSGHKAYAPFGGGVLVARKDLPTTGFGSAILKWSGEDNVAGIAAMGKALIILEKIGMDTLRQEEQKLTERALQGLSGLPGITIFGIKDTGDADYDKKGGVISFSLKGIMAHNLAREIAFTGGIGIRSGCHCSHILIKHLMNFNPFLEDVQHLIIKLFPSLTIPGVARMSLGIENTAEDIDLLIKALKETATRKVRNDKNTKAVINDFVNQAVDSIYEV